MERYPARSNDFATVAQSTARTSIRCIGRAAGAFILLLFVAITFSCATLKSVEYPVTTYILPDTAESFRWVPAFEGVSLARFNTQSPPLAVFAARIDLRAPGVSIVVTAPSSRTAGSLHAPATGGATTRAETTAQFVTIRGVAVAINASPFSPVNDIAGSSRRIEGLSADGGDVYSAAAPNGAAIVFAADNRAEIVPGVPGNQAAIQEGVGGFDQILRRGINLGAVDHRHPRTACGISADGWTLYFLVIDGRQAAWSVGATTHETAAWLHYIGAEDGINLDGGGSSAIVAGVPSAAGVPPGARQTTVARVLDSPIDHLVPGRMRLVGNNLGVLARPLPGDATPRAINQIAAQ